jgi:hypothetical protein
MYQLLSRLEVIVCTDSYNLELLAQKSGAKVTIETAVAQTDTCNGFHSSLPAQ